MSHCVLDSTTGRLIFKLEESHCSSHYRGELRGGGGGGGGTLTSQSQSSVDRDRLEGKERSADKHGNFGNKTTVM